MCSSWMALFAVLLLISLATNLAQQDGGDGGGLMVANATGTRVKCGQLGSNTELDHFTVTLASPTTWKLDLHDAGLQEVMKFHPLKCVMYDRGSQEYSAAGRLLILGTGCLLNNEDWASCYRKTNFPYPVPPHSPVLKIEMEVGVNSSSGAASWSIGNGTRHTRSRSTSVPSTDVSLEICAAVGNCKANSGYCIPSFYFVYETGADVDLRQAILPKVSQKPIPATADEFEKAAITSENADIIHANKIARERHSPLLTPFFNAWEATENFRISRSSAAVKDTWKQPHSLPDYGPYPHCPEDTHGRALPCTGSEKMTIYLSNVQLFQSEYVGDGKAAFGLSYKLSWGDRYAVHPCTIDLTNIHTSGKQFAVSSDGHWLPAFNALNAKQAESVTSASSSLGVNTAVGQPVTKKVTGELAWPKQLVLDRWYETVFYPTAVLDWTKYPFDKQTLQANISVMSVAAADLTLDATDAAFAHEDAQAGSQWTKDSASLKVVRIRGRDYMQVTVEVSRDVKGKFQSLFMPILAVAFMDSVVHLMVPYDEIAEVVLTSAIVIGVGVELVSPSFLGIPGDLTQMPYMQCMSLMLLIGGLKQLILLLGRLIWIKRKARIEAKMAPFEEQQEESRQSKASAAWQPADVSLASDAEKETLEQNSLQLQQFQSALADESKMIECYDRFLKFSVPVWYIMSFSIVTLVYLA